jgi:hypothetical protein
MTTTAYLFSGADISGRDDLLSRGPSPSAVEDDGQQPQSLVMRVVTYLTVAFVAFTSTPMREITYAAEAPSVLARWRDQVLDSVRRASSDGVPPNVTARANAASVLASLRDLDLEPHRVIGDPDGGVALYVFGGQKHLDGTRDKYARILSTNEGDVIAMWVDESSGRHDVWEADPSDLSNALSRIQSFIAG